MGGERGAALVELSIVLLLLLLVGFGCVTYSIRFAQRIAHSNAVTQIAFKVRVYCEMFPDVLVHKCLKEVVDQAAPILEQNGRPMKVRVSAYRLEGTKFTLKTDYTNDKSETPLPARFTAASLHSAELESAKLTETFRKLGRVFVTEAHSESKLRDTTNLLMFRLGEVYDRVVG